MIRLEKLKQDIVGSKVKSHIVNSFLQNDELTLECNNDSLIYVIKFLRDEKKFKFNTLMSICAVDYPEREKRFEVVYNLLSMKHNLRIRVKVMADEDTLVQSITSLFSSAQWYERETWDLYGIYFKGNNDLRRILTDYGFKGHPLRKDFPLTGNQEMRYDLEKEKVIYEQVKLQQDYRNFEFSSPWEGTEYILPGDEKATK